MAANPRIIATKKSSAVFLAIFSLANFFSSDALGQSVSVSPSSGPGNILINVTASGFQPIAYTTAGDPIYANTGFYVENALVARCENPNDSSWANCAVTFRAPTGLGAHTIRASGGDQTANGSFTVNPPSLQIAPAFGPAGTQLSLNGQTFAAASYVAVYVDGSFWQNIGMTDESGNFSTSITMSLPDGPHQITAATVGVSASAPFTSTNCIGSVTAGPDGGTVKHPDGTSTPLTPGTAAPLQLGDTVQSGAGGKLPLSLIDGTQFTMSENSRLTLDNYVYDPSNPANSSAHYNFFAGAFNYVSGLIGKTPHPNDNLDSPMGGTGIRGTHFISRIAPCSTTNEIYLIEGELALTPKATPGVTNILDGPISIFLTASNVTTAALDQATFNSISNQIFQTTGVVTFSSWQVQYFGCTNNLLAAPDADPDGDGQNNLNEFLAGTDPTRGDSFFHIISAVVENNDMRLAWSCGGGRTNVLQSAAGLDGRWSNVSGNITLGGGGDVTTNFLDAGAITNATAKFYRVRLVQ